MFPAAFSEVSFSSRGFISQWETDPSRNFHTTFRMESGPDLDKLDFDVYSLLNVDRIC